MVEAKGREHLGQAGDPPVPHSHNDVPRIGLESPNDGNLMGNYIEKYLYDAVGNIMLMEHYSPDQLSKPKWSRIYNYNEHSLIREELNSTHNNQLSNTIIHRENINNTTTEDYVHDKHGNIIRMPHLANHLNSTDANMHWDYKDQLQQIDTRNGDTQEGKVYYVYDAAGQRVRKVWEKSIGLVEERIYLGTLEVFRRRNVSDSLTLERETLHIMGDKQRIALIETRIHGREPNIPDQLIRYQFGNHLDSASMELDEKAQIISYEEYTPYGSTSFQSGQILAEVKTQALPVYRYGEG